MIQVVKKAIERPSVDFSQKLVIICGISATPQLITLMTPRDNDKPCLTLLCKNIIFHNSCKELTKPKTKQVPEYIQRLCLFQLKRDE